jgi:hypothetical protein
MLTLLQSVLKEKKKIATSDFVLALTFFIYIKRGTTFGFKTLEGFGRSKHSSVSLETRLRPVGTRILGSILDSDKRCSRVHNNQTGSGAHPAS